MKSFAIVRHGVLWVGFGLSLIVISLFLFVFYFSPAIEFTGGITAQIAGLPNPKTLETDLNRTIEGFSGINATVKVSTMGENTSIVIPFTNTFGTVQIDEQNAIKKTIDSSVTAGGSGASLLSFSTVGNSFGSYARRTAITYLILGIIAMVLYVFFAFIKIRHFIDPLMLGIITTITMLFDVIVPLGLYGILMAMFVQYQVDTLVLVAVLSIMGYSINDTIIILDRIRENIIASGKKDISLSQTEEIFDRSLRQTMRRSIGTSLSTLVVMIVMIIVGEGDMQRLSILMSFGVIVGTFSSIFFATPGLYLLIKWSQNKKK